MSANLVEVHSIAAPVENTPVDINDDAHRQPQPSSFRLQMKALMTKSAFTQKRQYRTNICQILFPLCMILLLFLLQTLVDNIIQSNFGETIPANLHPARTDPFLIFYDEDVENCDDSTSLVFDSTLGKLVSSSNGLQGIGSLSRDGNGTGVLGKVLLPPQFGGVQGLLAVGGRKFYERGGVNGAPTTLCRRRPRLLTQLNLDPQEDTAAMHAKLFQSWGDPANQFLGGFEFSEFDAASKRARFNAFVNDTFTGLMDLPILSSLLSNAVFREFRASDGIPLTSQTQINFAGTRGYPTDEKPITFDLISLVGPNIYLYIFFLLMPVFLGNIVSEKENQLREIMKMMGLQSRTYWTVTYIFNFCLYLIAVSFMIGVAAILGFRFFTVNSFGVMFLLFFLWGHVLCALAFLLSVFFNQARSATVIGYLIVFGTGLIGESLITNFFQGDSSASTLFIIQLWPAFAFYRGLLDLSVAVASEGSGLRMSDLRDADVYIDTVYIYLAVEWAVIMLLAVYLEQVVPARYGVKKHPLFCIRKRQSSARPNESQQKMFGEDVAEQERLAMSDADLRSSIKLQHLRKEFPASNGGMGLTAVHDLSMQIKYGECVTWLGSNGAGKSTSISMLCGYQEPTSGTAKIFGYDILTEIDSIHSIMGVCPQDNVLWPDLTGGEHLQFYGRLKGLEGADLEAAVIQSLKEVELLEVRNKTAQAYSGGMKRRLCVAISLIGNPKVVLLDEPTTGLDPASRRQLWDVINGKKRHCAMLLTTHSMEEAEFLADALGIFEHGRLVCMGTADELKSRFEQGYKITVSHDPERVAEVNEMVMGLVAGTRLLSCIGGTSSFEIPNDSSNLAIVFQAMNEIVKSNESPIRDWGISNTTLEEVFVRIATGNAPELAEKPGDPEQ